VAMKRCEADLHFYDMEKHKSCPYCERQMGNQRPFQGVAEKGGAADASSAPTVLMESESKKPISVPGPVHDRPTAAQLSKEATPAESLPVESTPTVFMSAPDPATRLGPSNFFSEQSVPDELSNAKPPPAAGPAPKLDEMTVMVLGENIPFNPAVGWLVCTEGPERGKDYRIKAGINEIGREEDPEVNIVIKGDSLISRRYHAEIQYDPEENVFYLIQKKNAAVKVNDVKVKRPTRLNPYDVLELGETKLLFVPLCSEKFQWPNGP
jgi:hypothetical protein